MGDDQLVGEDGSLTGLSLGDFDGDGTLDLAIFDGAESGLLDDDDVREAATLVGKGNAVVMLDISQLLTCPRNEEVDQDPVIP